MNAGQKPQHDSISLRQQSEVLRREGKQLIRDCRALLQARQQLSRAIKAHLDEGNLRFPAGRSRPHGEPWPEARLNQHLRSSDMPLSMPAFWIGRVVTLRLSDGRELREVRIVAASNEEKWLRVQMDGTLETIAVGQVTAFLPR